MQKFKFHI